MRPSFVGALALLGVLICFPLLAALFESPRPVDYESDSIWDAKMGAVYWANLYRKTNDLNEVVWEQRLEMPAQEHADYLAKHPECWRVRELAHQCGDEPPLEARLWGVEKVIINCTMVGCKIDSDPPGIPPRYAWKSGGEIIAFPKLLTPGIAVEQWKASPDHNAYLLKPRFIHVGVGVAKREGGYIFVMVFGEPL